MASAPLLLLQIVICSILSWGLAPASPACPGPAQKVFPQLVAGAALTWVRRMRRKRPFLTGQVGHSEPHMVTSDSPKPSSSELHAPAVMPQASGIFSTSDSSVFPVNIQLVLGTRQRHCPRHGTEILRRHSRVLHEPCTPSPQILLYLQLGLFQMQ
uniref:Uncharacterized protein n=1 Tax=Catharus ustulatus TaxID=91951 RepID=A0A8C3TMZ7_CATUS